MTRTDAGARLQRLDQIAAQLKQGTPCTIGDLAEQFQVSARTIARDLALMRAQGLPVEAERGRGGGVRLDRNWGVGRMALSYGEAVDLLISLAVAEQMNSPMFLANLGAVRRQLIASFSPEKRGRVEGLKSRILIGVTASTYVQAGVQSPPRRVVQALHQGFLDLEALEIGYRREDGAKSTRQIEPHYLLLKYPVWYVLAFDHLRDAPRSFRCDRILHAMRSGASFRLRPKSAFRSVLEAENLLL
jgi:predicted DNA-binding transcriptional regulator YafY